MVDRDDNTIRKASYKEIYEKLLRHRIVHVIVFNDSGEMALQLRSRNKGFCPLHWCTTAGGHVQSGETNEQAGLRELEEELGVKPELSFMSKEIYVSEDYKGRGDLEKFLITFKASHNGPFEINPEEVEQVGFFSLAQIQEMIDNGEKFHPELLFLLKEHFNIRT